MSVIQLIASPQPLPSSLTLIDPEVNEGKPFAYGPTNGLSKWFRAIPINEGYRPDYCDFGYDAIADLPKILPPHIYFFEGIDGFYDSQPENFREQSRLELKKFRAYLRQVINIMGEVVLISQSLPGNLICSSSQIAEITVCIDDWDLDSEWFNIFQGHICHCVNQHLQIAHERMTISSPAGVASCCVTLLACPHKLPAGYAKEHKMAFPDVFSPQYNQHEVVIEERGYQVKEPFMLYLDALSDLPSILPPHLYISGLNPSFYPWGNDCDQKNRRNTVKNLINYLQAIVDEQGEVWYIRQWLPHNIAKADSVKTRVMKVRDLNVDCKEFEFELCTLYHFVR